MNEYKVFISNNVQTFVVLMITIKDFEELLLWLCF